MLVVTTMALSAIPLSYLLVTLSTATILSAEGQLPVSTTSLPETYGYLTIRPSMTVTTHAAFTTGPWNAGTTTETVNASGDMATALNFVTPDTATKINDVTSEPPSTTFTSASRFKALPNPTAAPLQIVCPNSNPQHFLATSWLILTDEDIMYRLYRISQQGDVTKYKDWYNTQSGMKVTHNVTSKDTLMIYGDTCNHTATYQCKRSARVGYTNEVHSFSVSNCTFARKVDIGSHVNLFAPVNTSPHLTAASFTLAIGPIVWFISMY